MGRLGSLPARLGTIDQRTARPAPKVADDVYRTAEHRAWAAQVIADAGGRCQWPGCDKALPQYRMVADHIDEVKDGGALRGRGQCLCVAHNTLKGLRARAARQAR